MTLKKNIFANYAGVGAVALGPIFALPWYLSALGPKQFGLIGFIVMLQAVLGLLDAGIGQALVREIAVRFDGTEKGNYKTAVFLFGFERVYWVFAISIAFFIILLAEVISSNWLKLEGLPINTGTNALYGAAFIFAFQFPGSVYRSLLVGTQAHVTLNSIMLCSSVVRHVGGVLVIFFSPTLISYLIWHVLAALLETLIRAIFAWLTLKIKRDKVKWDFRELKPALALVVTMSGATWLGALTVQMDKIVLSRMVSIEAFGYYTIAGTVSVGMLQLIYPLVQALLPRAVQLRSKLEALRKLNFKLLSIIIVLSVFGAFVFIMVGEWLLNAWLRDEEIVSAVYPILSVLLLGTCLNAFYNVGYINWIVHEKVYRVFQVNLISLLLSIVLIPCFVFWQGVIGAAFGWLAINLIGFLVSLEWLKRK